MIAPLALLLLEDNEADAWFIMEMLQKTDDQLWQVTRAQRLSTALELLSQSQFEVVLLDLTLQDYQGLETLIRVRQTAPELPINVLTSIDNQQISLQRMSEKSKLMSNA
jgi:two-component system, cell cycle response regulator